MVRSDEMVLVLDQELMVALRNVIESSFGSVWSRFSVRWHRMNGVRVLHQEAY